MASLDKKRLQKLAGILSESYELESDKIYVKDDHEGKMAKAQLQKIVHYANELLELMPDDAELESWVQSKLAVVEDNMSIVAHYLLDETPEEKTLNEAEYQGRKVTLNKPVRGGSKKFYVYVKDPNTDKVKKVSFGDPNMEIKKDNPERRKSFRARHNCDNPGPKTKARYWSCRMWEE